MAPLAARLLLLAALAVCLLAAPAHAGRDLGVKQAGPRILAAETYSHDQELPDYLDHIPRRKALATTCGRTTVVIKSQYLGPYDLHNYIFNMTFYNGCAFNVTSPLRVFQCQDFGNVWQGILKNPAKNPTIYQTGESSGRCRTCRGTAT
ncbi:hypothetical protein CLOM_g14895 [Closterium sp. NIES-68]|nr:hypothetical protein CLOM_g14895 [Closterium sp. NIES-68]GJP75544.1 hypothetical protein CLOP_g5977 [Closterium sp. NIES-67]